MSYSLDGGQFTQNGLFLNQSAGSHTVIVMDAKGCSYDTVLVLTEPDLISADVKIDGVFCSDQSDAKIKITGKGGRSNYTYYLKPGLFVNKTGSFEGLSPGTYTLTITDSARCQFDTIIVVELPTNPLLTTFTHGDIGCYGTGNEGWAQVYVTGGATPYSYMWNTSPVQTDDKATELRFGWHGVLVTDANGCSKKDSVYIDPGPCCDEVFIPNAFSPNNDGKNDIWHIVTATGIELQQLAIYDRWGNRVWSATDIFQGWDGTYKGKEEDMNTFYYIFRYRCLNDGQDYLKKGDLILIR
jgi:gliding motility-associated-like protein